MINDKTLFSSLEEHFHSLIKCWQSILSQDPYYAQEPHLLITGIIGKLFSDAPYIMLEIPIKVSTIQVK